MLIWWGGHMELNRTLNTTESLAKKSFFLA